MMTVMKTVLFTDESRASPNDTDGLITPLARGVWRSFKFAPFLVCFFFRVESWATAHG